MRTEFKFVLLLGLIIGFLLGCTTDESPVADSLELPPTWTLLPTGEPRPSATYIPTRALPSATPQPVLPNSTPTDIPVVEDIFVREGVPVPQPDEVIEVENADQLVELARWGYGAINQVSHTRDGQLMLVQTDVGVYAYQVGTLNEVWRFQPGGEVFACGLDEDGRVLVKVEGEKIFLLDPDNGRVLDSYPGEISEEVEPIPSHDLYHEDGKIIRYSDQLVLLKFWELDLPGWLYFSGISPGGNYVVFTGDDSGLAVYRISDGERVVLYDPQDMISMVIPHRAKPAQLSGPGPDRINTFVFNRSEQFFIAANGRGQIFFFDLQREDLHVTMHGNGGQLLIPPYGDKVIYYDCSTLEFYEIPSGERESEINYGNCCQDMMFSPGGTRIAQGGILWNVENGKFQTMPENEKVIGFSENGSYVYAIREEWWWVKRRTEDLKLHHQVNLDRTPDPSLEGRDEYFTYDWTVGEYWKTYPDGAFVIGGWYGTPYLVWSTENGERVAVGQGGSDYHRFAFSPDGQYLININSGGVTYIRERQSDGDYTLLTRREAWGQDIDFIGNKNLLLTDNIIQVYSLPNMKLVKEIGLNDFIRVTAVSPDGQLVAASLGDKVVLVDFETEDVIHTLDVSTWGVYSLAFSPDGRYLTTASSSGVIRLWGVPLSQSE